MIRAVGFAYVLALVYVIGHRAATFFPNRVLCIHFTILTRQ